MDGGEILHVLVVGFHHKKGCVVEYSYPPIEREESTEEKEEQKKEECWLPQEWKHLPSLALPDGAHNLQQDVIYFLLPSRNDQGKAIYGISCYRQIWSESLVARSSDVTRSTVQKCVVVLSRSPLFGVLKAKLQLITEAYFNEKDFSKVQVLSQMYSNLCQMFNGGEDMVDGQAAFMDISVRHLIRTYRHRVVLLFKLLLLERKVLFHIFPVQELGDTLIALLSLFPGLLERGLSNGMTSLSSRCSSPQSIEEKVEEANEAVSVVDEDEIQNGERMETSQVDNVSEISVTDEKVALLPELGPDPLIIAKDSYGFPLSIFTLGNIFNPYVGLAMLESLGHKKTRGFVVGATNALFLQRKEYFDVVVTLDDEGIGNVEILDPQLKKALNLTSADLRFADFLIKNVDGSAEEAPVYEGGNEWCREQFRAYLLSLGSSLRSGLQPAYADFGMAFISAWKKTVNARRWIDEGKYEDLVSVPPGHAFAGQIGMYDVMLRVEHSVGGNEQARKAFSALSSTGKQLGATGERMKSGLTSWFKGVTGQTSQVLTSITTPTAEEVTEETMNDSLKNNK